MNGFYKKSENTTINVPVKQIDKDKIVVAIKMNNHITMDNMAQIIGKSRKTVMRLLKKSNQIVWVSSDNTGY